MLDLNIYSNHGPDFSKVIHKIEIEGTKEISEIIVWSLKEIEHLLNISNHTMCTRNKYFKRLKL